MDPVQVVATLPGGVVALSLGWLSVVLVRTRRGDRANQSLAAFSALVAVNYVLVVSATLLTPSRSPEGSRPPVAEAFLIAAYLVQLLEPLALLYTSSVLTGRAMLRSRRVLIPVAVIGAGLVAGVAMEPRAVVHPGGVDRVVYEAYVTVPYLVAATLTAIAALRGDPASRVPRGFAIGLGVVAYFRIGPAFDLHRVGLLLDTIPRVQRIVGLAAMLAGILLALLVAFAVVARSTRRDVRGARALFLWVAALCAAVTAAIGAPPLAALALLGMGPDPPPTATLSYVSAFASGGLYAFRWIVFAAVAGPAFLRNQVVDVDAKLRRSLVAGIAAGTILLLLFASVVLIDLTIRTGSTLTSFGFVFIFALVLVATQAGRVARLAADALVPPPKIQDAYRLLRRVEVYRDAVLAVRAGRAKEAALADLARRLELTGEEIALATAPEREPGRIGPGARVGGRYRIDRVLGAGSFGRVFAALDETTGKTMAIKEVEERGLRRALARIEAEIRVAARLQHPNVLAARDVFTSEGHTLVVLDYAEGGSVADALEAGPLPEERAVGVILDVLAALEHGHAKGVIHRDVKPANVLLHDGRALLSDFGISLVRDSSAAETLDVAELPAGTPGYLPPEALVTGYIDHRADIYAAGTLLHEMLSGRHPLDGGTPTRIPPPLREVIATARAEDPDARYPTAAAMRRAILDARAAKRPPAGPQG